MYRLQTSPYETRQEEYRDDPWKMLIICFMLNQTSHKQVDQVRHQFFEKFPTPEKLVLAEDSEISKMIKPLGFYNKRAKQWKRFSMEWIELTRKYDSDYPPMFEIEKLYGVGKYAADSWRVFQLYEYGTEVEDHVLVWYVDWARAEMEKEKREISPCVPMVVYYLHYKDDRHIINNWNVCRDYACCVMARTQLEAIEKVKDIASKQPGHKHIKIMGFGHAKPEWVNEDSPLKSDESLYSNEVSKVFQRIKEKNMTAKNIYKEQQKKNYVFE
jgi:endonuclease III